MSFSRTTKLQIYYTFHKLKEWILLVNIYIYICIYDNNKPIASNIGIIRARANECAITVASSGGGGGGRIVAVCLFMRETGRPVITAEPPPTTFRQRATRCRIVDLGGKYIIARSFDNWSREISFTGTLKLAGSKEGERAAEMLKLGRVSTRSSGSKLARVYITINFSTGL